jgi:hypothetical protein
MKVLSTLLLAAALVFSTLNLNATVKPPRGRYKKAYDATFVLYGSSKSDDVTNHPMCSATAFKKVQGGYLLLSAGHCTAQGDPEGFPPDLTYGVSNDIGTPIYPVRVIKAILDDKTNVDYSILFFPTTLRVSVMQLGDEGSERIGDKTYNFNFSKGVVKMLSEGVVAAPPVPEGEVKNLWLVDQFAAGGSSGSAVISKRTNKIIGIISYGWSDRTMPEGVVPISVVRLELLKLSQQGLLPL